MERIPLSAFLKALFPSLGDSAYIEIRAKHKSGHITQEWATSIEEVIALAKPLREEHDVWFGLGARNKKRGKAEDVCLLSCLWADIDAEKFSSKSKEEALAFVESLPLSPSIVVDSGGGLQAYWLLDYSTSDVAWVRKIMRALHHDLSRHVTKPFDTVYDPSRVFRLPYTKNYKYAPPQDVLILQFTPDRRYSVEALTQALSVPEETEDQPTVYDFSVFTKIDIPPRDLIIKARNFGLKGWVFDALDRPDQHDHGDQSVLDYAVCRELSRILTPAEVDLVWMKSRLGGRDKTQRRQDYRRRTILRAWHDAQASSNTPGPAPDGNPQDQYAASLPGLYHWSVGNGLVLVGRRSDIRLANFKPEILNVLEVENGENKPSLAYDMRFVLTTGETERLRLTSDDLRSDASLREKLTKILPISFIVYPPGWGHLSAAMRELAASLVVSRERVYAQMGWTTFEGRPIFILPSAAGGITAEGLDASHTFDQEYLDTLPEKMRLYGVGVQPAISAQERVALATVLSRIISLSDATVGVSCVVQAFAGPLSSLGLRTSPPLVHLLGQTGALKTTIATLALSLFGRFDSDNVPESWVSTQNSLAKRLYEARDMTLLIDDYKRGKSEPSSLIQTYADGTTRSRLRSGQENQTALVPRGLLLSTGEDVWEEHQSTDARTITVRMRKVDGDDRLALLSCLDGLQEDARQGRLAKIGGTYLMWLARTGLEVVRDLYTIARRDSVASLRQTHGGTHLRTLNTMSSLFAAGVLVERFVAEMFPDALAVYRDRRDEAWRELLDSSTKNAEEASLRAPFEFMISELQDAFARGDIHFTAKSAHESTVLGSYLGTQSVGYYDDANVYLTHNATYDWLLRRAAARRVDLSFSWKAFCQGTREKLGPYMSNGKDRRTSCLLRDRQEYVRAVVIPRYFVDLSAVSRESSELSLEQNCL